MMMISVLIQGCWCNEVMMLDGCRALEVTNHVLEIQSLDQILLVFDTSSTLPLEVVERFSKKGDQLGANCANNMTRRMDAVLEIFEQKIQTFGHEQKLTAIYFEEFGLAKTKRFEAGSLALLLATISLMLSTTGLVVSQTQINDINRRLNTMSDYIDSLKNNQKIINENVAYLFEGQTFIGAEKDLIIEYMNQLKTIHSCDFMSLYFDIALAKLEMRLNVLLKEIISRQFSYDFIDLQSLEKITSHNYFQNSIYLINPSMLYKVGQIDFVSMKDRKLSVLLSFPKIDRAFKYKRVTILESPHELLFDKLNYESFHSFLMPIDIDLQNVSSDINVLRSGQNCIKNNLFEACDGNGKLTYGNTLCIAGLFKGIDSHCSKSNPFVFDFHIAYSKEGALLNMKNDAFVKDMVTQKILYKSTTENPKCIYLTARDNLIVKSIFRKEHLFPMTLSFKVVSKHYDLIHDIREMDNFTSPVYNHTKTYTPIVIADVVDSEVLEIVAISVSTFVMVLIIIFIMIKLGGCKKRETINGNELFS